MTLPDPPWAVLAPDDRHVQARQHQAAHDIDQVAHAGPADHRALAIEQADRDQILLALGREGIDHHVRTEVEGLIGIGDPNREGLAVHKLAAGRVRDKGDLAAQAGYAGQRKGRRPVAQVGDGMAELNGAAGVALRLLIEAACYAA